MTTTLAVQARRAGRLGRFTLHFFEMCAPMCVGFAIGDLIYFLAAGMFGYSEPFSELPELSVGLVTLTMTAPMVAWMAYRGMPRRPIAEMAAVMPVLGAALLVLGWLSLRPRGDLYHSALIVTVPAGRFVIEQSWPIPSGDKEQRGVVAEGPVGTQRARSLRFPRYEIRRWRDGVIADLDEAVASPQLLTDDVVVAERLLELVPEVPTPVWGRDEVGAGEMWNSNSLISWLIARSGLDVDAVHPPAGGRAPGWDAGVTIARRQAPATPGLRHEPVTTTLDALPSGRVRGRFGFASAWSR